MHNYNVPDISFYQIQLFLTVADERNFSQAASIMHLTQPTLSKRIHALENAIGLLLFDREKRPIQLTPEGEILYAHWKLICDQFKLSIEDAFRKQKDKRNSLNVCWFDSGNMLAPLSIVGQQLKKSCPGLLFHLSYSPFLKWRNLLLHDDIQIMITIRMEAEQLQEEFEWQEISTCPKLVCMLESNPLSRKKEISYRDLHNQKFVMLSPVETPFYKKYVQSICNARGFEPIIARYAPDANSLVHCLQEDSDVLVCDRYLRNIENPVIKCFPLPETYSGLIAVWKKERSSFAIKEYIRLLREYYTNHKAPETNLL